MKKKKKQNDRRSIKATVSKLLALPENTIAGGMHIEINSVHEVVIENCRGVLEYTPERIRLLTSGAVVRFSGRGLTLESISRTAAVVCGTITSIEFAA